MFPGQVETFQVDIAGAPASTRTPASAPSSAASTTPRCASRCASSPPTSSTQWLEEAAHDRVDSRGSAASSTSTRSCARRTAGRRTGLPRTLIGWLTTTDHKAIGIAYAVTSLVFLAIGGALAGIIRTELARPGPAGRSTSQTYNSLFTIHGSVMVYLFAVPFGFALANYLVPLQIGAPDLAFPRLNALSYWLYLFGGVDDAARLPHRRRRGGVRLVRLPAAVGTDRLAGPRRRPVGRRRSSSPARRARSARST